MTKYTEPKYRTIHEAEAGELEILKEKVTGSLWKPAFHIHPEHGLLNDPNGLAYFNGAFHVFYQWFPFGAYHGMKHWAHVTSPNLVDWERLPTALAPTEDYESHGAYSGASMEVDGKLYLYYTGNIKYSAEDRSANQCLAIMEKDGQVRKYDHNPIIEGVPAGYTGHVRDPKVFHKGNMYYMLLGAQREDRTGAIIVYESKDALNWSFKGELRLDLDLPDSCYMLECPDYFDINGQDVLIVSPQGLEPKQHDYLNLYNVIYALGKLDIENLTFDVTSYQELDKGFDFYAPQSFEGSKKERLLFGWAGMAEVDYPTDREDWAHCMTLPRELDIVNGLLVQKPATELKQLRSESHSGSMTLDSGSTGLHSGFHSFELETTMESRGAEVFGLELFASETEGLVLAFDRSSQTVSLNRENFHASFDKENDLVRSAELNIGDSVKVQAFVDRSIAEIFINDGEVVFTTRVFPDNQSTGVKLFTDTELTCSYTIHQLKSTNSL
ncbi:glycoside hydrolase family 32 protein [Rossellomorea vietnamensis]|uniref:glycoside hydrolase family 32 protein n=1 Tax=Rossellomorea vietnamensis TaxID=218284 RepID=UPI001E3DDE20|nr:sucrose-6-phosphate hydrolase [Rossellomorea vietnamensis]MCC5803876.1 sucrose-6-phosphate hydrolase [Rossellomorea vietnamensis]